MKINIVGGSGVMGTLHKPILEAAGHKVIISGRNSILSMEEAAKSSDLTIISVPIPAVENTIQKVAPYCTAIMDFTSLKCFPIKAMLKYSNKSCEVAGLHPLYGKVLSIKERTIIYCLTNRAGKKCEEIVNAFKIAGAKIITATPQEHDKIIAITQNARNRLLEAYITLIKNSGISINEAYKFAPPPTKILLDLIARQINESNDEMYKAMKNFNPNKNITDSLTKSIKNPSNAKELRELYNTELKSAQERAKKLIEDNK